MIPPTNDMILNFINVPNELRDEIRITTKLFESGDVSFTIFNIQVVGNKFIGDDIVYKKNPLLVELIPRNFAIIAYELMGKWLLKLSMGLRKFNGVEDDNIDNNNTNDIEYLNLLPDDSCVITEKANGKNMSITSCVIDVNNQLINHFIIGSKNVKAVYQYIDRKIVPVFCGSPLISEMAAVVSTMLDMLSDDNINSLIELLQTHTLIGEYMDGKHIIPLPDKPYIEFFSLVYSSIHQMNNNWLCSLCVNGVLTLGSQIPNSYFINHKILNELYDVPILQALSLLGLPVVNCYNITADTVEELTKKVDKQLNTPVGEGYVVYVNGIVNGISYTREIYKWKSSMYVLLRSLRTILMKVDEINTSNIKDIFNKITTVFAARSKSFSIDANTIQLMTNYARHFTVYIARNGINPRNMFNVQTGDGFAYYVSKMKKDLSIEPGMYCEDIVYNDDLIANTNQKIKMFMFINTRIGCGKTTVCTVIAKILSDRGFTVVIFERDDYGNDKNGAENALRLIVDKLFNDKNGVKACIIISQNNPNGPMARVPKDILSFVEIIPLNGQIYTNDKDTLAACMVSTLKRSLDANVKHCIKDFDTALNASKYWFGELIARGKIRDTKMMSIPTPCICASSINARELMTLLKERNDDEILRNAILNAKVTISWDFERLKRNSFHRWVGINIPTSYIEHIIGDTNTSIPDSIRNMITIRDEYHITLGVFPTIDELNDLKNEYDNGKKIISIVSLRSIVTSMGTLIALEVADRPLAHITLVSKGYNARDAVKLFDGSFENYSIQLFDKLEIKNYTFNTVLNA